MGNDVLYYNTKYYNISFYLSSLNYVVYYFGENAISRCCVQMPPFMRGDIIAMSQKERQRYHVLKMVISGRIT